MTLLDKKELTPDTKYQHRVLVKKPLFILLSIFVSIFLVATATYAVTTVGENVLVGGNLTVSGTISEGGTGLSNKYVPYTGATANVNLGSQALTTTGNIGWDANNYIYSSAGIIFIMPESEISIGGASPKAIQASAFRIGLNSLDTTEWAYLDGQNQAVKTTSNPTFATGVKIGNLTLANGSITDSSGAISFDNENLTTTGTGTFGTLKVKDTTSAISAIFSTSLLTTPDKTFTFPNASGTFALLENNQTFTGIPTFSNATYSALFTGGYVGIGTAVPQSLLSLDTPLDGALKYLQIDFAFSIPPSADCDADNEAGRLIAYSTSTPRLYLCTGSSGWATSTFSF